MKIDLKFRVWDKVRKKMIILDHPWLCSEYNSLCFSNDELLGHFGDWPPDYDEDLDHYEIMSYTSSKDKNKKDVFEGDIVKWDGSSSEKYEVSIEGGIIWLSPYPDNETLDVHLFNYDISSKQLEVIGNIYENFETI